MRMFSKLLAAAVAAVLSFAATPSAHAQPTEVLLLPIASTWRYNHMDCLDAVGWAATNYDDTVGNWASGVGGFTGGETRVEALVGVNTSVLPAPNAAGRLGRAMYFRTQFTINSTAGVSLVFSNRLDDNAAYYL